MDVLKVAFLQSKSRNGTKFENYNTGKRNSL